MPEGIIQLAEAFEQAAAESDLVQSGETETDEPSVDVDAEAEVEQAEGVAEDQPEVAETPAEEEDEDDSLMAAMLEEAEESDNDQSGSDGSLDLETEITVDLGNGAETVTIKDLVESGMRQADYTRKTQALAAARADNETAVEFHEQFQSDPIAFAKLLAVKAGLISEADAGQLLDSDVATIQSEAEIEAEVERRLEERLASDPGVRQAQIDAAWATANAEFDRIAAENEVTIPQELRQSIVDEAARKGIVDLELVFLARKARAESKRTRTAEKKKAAASSRPSSSPVAEPETEEKADPDVFADLADAFMAAKKDLAAAV